MSKMKRNIVVVILIAVFSSVGQCAVDYQYSSQDGLVDGTVAEGSSVIISCFFTGDKPPGTSRWTLNKQDVALNCDVQTPGQGIIEPTTHCSPDSGDGTANLSFVIKEVSLDRDKDSWVCKNAGRNEQLTIPIAVVGTSSHDGKNLYKRKDHLSVIADIGCSYPLGELLWCLDDGTEVKCSNQTSWADKVFGTNPVITQTNESCINYKTPGVLKYKSTIDGSITGPASCDEYKLYYSLNGIEYKENVIEISLEDFNKSSSTLQLPCSFCKTCTYGLQTATIIAVVQLIVLIMFTIVHEVYRRLLFGKGPDEVYKIFVLGSWFMMIASLLLDLTSLLLYIIVLVQCQEHILLQTMFIAVILFASIFNVQVFRWIQHVKRKYIGRQPVVNTTEAPYLQRDGNVYSREKIDVTNQSNADSAHGQSIASEATDLNVIREEEEVQ